MVYHRMLKPGEADHTLLLAATLARWKCQIFLPNGGGGGWGGGGGVYSKIHFTITNLLVAVRIQRISSPTV